MYNWSDGDFFTKTLAISLGFSKQLGMQSSCQFQAMCQSIMEAMLLVCAWVNSERSSEASLSTSEAITPTNFGSLASKIPKDGKISEAFLGGIFPAALTINL